MLLRKRSRWGDVLKMETGRWYIDVVGDSPFAEGEGGVYVSEGGDLESELS